MLRTAKLIRALTVVAALALVVNTSAAQSLTELPPNSRIRLVLVDSLRQGPLFPARQLVVGQLVRSSADSVTLRLMKSGEFSVARVGVKQIRVSRGVSRARSALTVGLSLGLLGVVVVFEESGNQRYHRTQDRLVAGGIGFGAGALLGALSPFEQWRRIRN